VASLHYLYRAVDHDDQVNEGRETDNVARSALRIRLTSSGCP